VLCRTFQPFLFAIELYVPPFTASEYLQTFLPIYLTLLYFSWRSTQA